jgi:hypothetical protein
MFANYMLLVIKPPKLRAVVFRNAFRLKFNTHASIGLAFAKEWLSGLQRRGSLPISAGLSITLA